jgi:hypothetical protein
MWPLPPPNLRIGSPWAMPKGKLRSKRGVGTPVPDHISVMQALVVRRAARALGLGQSAVSCRVRELLAAVRRRQLDVALIIKTADATGCEVTSHFLEVPIAIRRVRFAALLTGRFTFPIGSPPQLPHQ